MSEWTINQINQTMNKQVKSIDKSQCRPIGKSNAIFARNCSTINISNPISACTQEIDHSNATCATRHSFTSPIWLHIWEYTLANDPSNAAHVIKRSNVTLISNGINSFTLANVLTNAAGVINHLLWSIIWLLTWEYTPANGHTSAVSATEHSTAIIICLDTNAHNTLLTCHNLSPTVRMNL